MMDRWRRLSLRMVGGAMTLVAFMPSAEAAESWFASLISTEQEIQIGAEQHPRIVEEFGGAYDNPQLVDYVTSIGKFLSLTSERPELDFTFTVLNSPVVNAFALPGGFVYVTRGLLALAQNEAELAGVLAHEIGHVSARHGVERYGQSIVTNLGLMLLGAVSDSETVAKVAQTGALALIQSYSRDQEFESDTLGVRYLSRAGFDPRAMSGFLAQLKAHSDLEAKRLGLGEAGNSFDLFATHPRTSERVDLAIKNARLTQVSNPIVARDIYLKKIDGMLYGDDPAQGYIRGREFIHPEMRFAFEVPEEFTLLNGAAQVLARGPDGAIIRFDGAKRADSRSMSDYIRDVWLADNTLDGVASITIGNFPAATAAIRTESDGQELDIRVIAIAFDDQTIYRFLFATPPDKTAAFSEPFRRTTYSFRRVGAWEASRIRPQRLRIYTVRRGETLEALAKRLPFEDYQIERFRVMNGLGPDDTVRAGDQVKLVVE